MIDAMFVHSWLQFLPQREAPARPPRPLSIVTMTALQRNR
jgi:hypothetical protein